MRYRKYVYHHLCIDDIIIIMVIMVIFKCYFSREHIAFRMKNGVKIEFGKTNRLKALRMMENHA